MKSIIYS